MSQIMRYDMKMLTLCFLTVFVIHAAQTLVIFRYLSLQAAAEFITWEALTFKSSGRG